MVLGVDQFKSEYDSRFKLFHELMSKKVLEILLVSTPYDAWIMEEDCRLSERIVNEYRGLNLSKPPRLTWTSSAEEALALSEKGRFDMVITMPRLADMDVYDMGRKIKRKVPDLPVILLSHSVLPGQRQQMGPVKDSGIDRTFVWSGDTEILVALVKSVEDRLNADRDTRSAGIRIILLVEDSPIYLSSFLPVLYRELVSQTQALIEEGINEEHRLLTMRARPKILIAENYEAALKTYESYKPFILGVISDTRFPRENKLNDAAGISLLSYIKKDRWDIPLLLTSSEPSNEEKALAVPAVFIDKNSPSLHKEVRSFFMGKLGFGDFVFRTPGGQKIRRVSNLRAMEKTIPDIPDESFFHHWNRNDFSRWFFARTETVLASHIRPLTAEDFSFNVKEMKQYLISSIQKRRRRRQKGIVVNFDPAGFDPDTEFFKIGNGSLGGKARGLAFISTMLKKNAALHQKFDQTPIFVPQTLVVTTDGFDAFIEANGLKYLSTTDARDGEVAALFLKSKFPGWMIDQLAAYLSQIDYPLAVRSSSLLEDAQYRAYAGLYKTCMLPNDHPGPDERLNQLLAAIKLIYASTYFNGPKAFSKRVGHRTEEEKMAIIIQQLVGDTHGKFFYPAISGVGQSHNYYPFSKMRPEEGIATIALGLGKIVMEGRQTLRFSPKYPQLLPQRSSVDDILRSTQQYFYALKKDGSASQIELHEDDTLIKRPVEEAAEEMPVEMLSSTYLPEEHRIRDSVGRQGHRVITFAQVLKYGLFPLPDILRDVLSMGEQGMGCPVEMEFSVNLYPDKTRPGEFAVLQVRPMTAAVDQMQVSIEKDDITRAFCFSRQGLGNTDRDDLRDVIYVKPSAFDPSQTLAIAREIQILNAQILKSEKKYLLVGPGRWGSADRWLGIPVTWADICGVGAIVETFSDKLRTEPSQGSHFFHNITTLGINYITVSGENESFLNWEALLALPRVNETRYAVHARVQNRIRLKVDGRKSECVIYMDPHQSQIEKS
ncbi:MAG: hypothetical protein H8D81_00925 [Deltaproteobacteria bacterium]|nr:hypothetical protein [Deltaproteobacteria bacterium]